MYVKLPPKKEQLLTPYTHTHTYMHISASTHTSLNIPMHYSHIPTVLYIV